MADRFKTQDFPGTVCLKDWFVDPLSGRTIKGAMGTVSILEVKDVIGFDPGKGEANWVARVQGPTTSYTFPGCQVRAVIDHPTGRTPAPSADVVLVD